MPDHDIDSDFKTGLIAGAAAATEAFSEDELEEYAASAPLVDRLRERARQASRLVESLTRKVKQLQDENADLRAKLASVPWDYIDYEAVKRDSLEARLQEMLEELEDRAERELDEWREYWKTL